VTRLTLLTSAPMVDSACARLLLDHYGLDWDERDHFFVVASLASLFHGGHGPLPLVCGSGVRLTGPMAIVDRFDPEHPDRRLLPPDQPLRQRIEADWQRFNGALGTHVAVFAYYHLLPLRAQMIPVFAAPLPAGERWTVPFLYPLIDALFGMALRLQPARVADSLVHIRQILDQADARIADGRPWLYGEQRTLSDLALAASLMPLLVPPAYAINVPPEAVQPRALRDLVAETRQRPCAALAKRIYG
jgi:glutathione S-transferase